MKQQRVSSEKVALLREALQVDEETASDEELLAGVRGSYLEARVDLRLALDQVRESFSALPLIRKLRRDG